MQEIYNKKRVADPPDISEKSRPRKTWLRYIFLAVVIGNLD
jgi:hypothetical protein